MRCSGAARVAKIVAFNIKAGRAPPCPKHYLCQRRGWGPLLGDYSQNTVNSVDFTKLLFADYSLTQSTLAEPACRQLDSPHEDCGERVWAAAFRAGLCLSLPCPGPAQRYQGSIDRHTVLDLASPVPASSIVVITKTCWNILTVYVYCTVLYAVGKSSSGPHTSHKLPSDSFFCSDAQLSRNNGPQGRKHAKNSMVGR